MHSRFNSRDRFLLFAGVPTANLVNRVYFSTEFDEEQDDLLVHGLGFVFGCSRGILVERENKGIEIVDRLWEGIKLQPSAVNQMA